MSMNEINASRRLREAAKEKAEADKIVQVKAAEADAESKYLSGVGVARQRQAIVGGLQDSIIEFSGEIAGTTPKDVMDLLLLTQYFDMLKDVGSSGSGGKTLFLPHAPSAVGDLRQRKQERAHGVAEQVVPRSRRNLSSSFLRRPLWLLVLGRRATSPRNVYWLPLPSGAGETPRVSPRVRRFIGGGRMPGPS